MRLSRAPFVFALVALAAISSNAQAQPALGQFATPVPSSILDREKFSEWQDGRESPVADKELKNGPSDVLWTQDARIEWRGAKFGAGLKPGLRHLRIAFTKSIPVGSVLVRAGGKMSVLKPSAEYPGDLANEAQWTPATRISGGRITSDEVDAESFAFWSLPAGTETRALRFTHDAQAADRESCSLSTCRSAWVAYGPKILSTGSPGTR